MQNKQTNKQTNRQGHNAIRPRPHSLLAELFRELGELLAPGEAGVFRVLELETLRKSKRKKKMSTTIDLTAPSVERTRKEKLLFLRMGSTQPGQRFDYGTPPRGEAVR